MPPTDPLPHPIPSPPRRRSAGPTPEQAGFGARFTAAAAIGSVLNPINSSIIAIALVSIGRAFGVDAGATTWLVSALYLATAIGQPTAGRLADLFGPRRVYLAGMALVALGGLVGFVGTSIGMLVVARVVLGLGTSAAYPAAMTMVRRQSERLARPAPGRVLNALAVAGQTTMAIGPPLGGLLIAVGGWRTMFLINIPLAAIAAGFAVLWLPADEPRRRTGSAARELDPPGLLLFAATLTSVLLFLMRPAASRWWLLALGLVAGSMLTRWESRAPSPFLDVRMVARNGALTRTYLRQAVAMASTYCFIYGWTMWLEQSAGRSASAAGLLMTPSFVVAAGVSAVVTGPGLRTPLLAGAGVLTVGSASLLLLRADSPLWLLIVVSVVFGLQNGLANTTNQRAMFRQAPAAATGTAAGLLRTFSYLGALASASLIGTTFGPRATDAGLHHLAMILTVMSVVLVAATALDPALRRGRGARGSGAEELHADGPDADGLGVGEPEAGEPGAETPPYARARRWAATRSRVAQRREQ
ncbi:MFS transporter [Embleya hyalina]|uniref:MFS transporter n=1 Tax=Embleya hyalina TaxID=516124 RepID=A0A401Z0V3_9ACTN|nr:MFS transporter [Embleya hyalina]GCE00469.1 MFS transporter [Embleya hyalina]